MSKPLVVATPVELGCHSWGPFEWEHRRVYYPDGSDWTGQWSFGMRHVGQIAIIPPAWLLNLFVKWGWVELRTLDAEKLADLKELTDMIAEAKPWLDPRYK